MSKCKTHPQTEGKMELIVSDCLPCWMAWLEKRGGNQDITAYHLHIILTLVMREIDLAHVEAATANEGVRDLDRRQKR